MHRHSSQSLARSLTTIVFLHGSIWMELGGGGSVGGGDGLPEAATPRPQRRSSRSSFSAGGTLFATEEFYRMGASDFQPQGPRRVPRLPPREARGGEGIGPGRRDARRGLLRLPPQQARQAGGPRAGQPAGHGAQQMGPLRRVRQLLRPAGPL
jgi:hypothetical protein